MSFVHNFTNLLSELWRSDERRRLVSFRSPLEIWQDNPTYVLLEIVTYIWAALLVRHACRHGGRLCWLWLAAMLHGLVVESLSYLLPDIDSFWHGISSVMFLNQRLPLHIVLFYPCYHYTTNAVVARLKLPWWAEPFTVALGDVLLDIPFDILGVKYLWWVWHDTDQNIFDRSYNVPLTSYIFHMAFASSFTAVLGMSRWLMMGTRDPERRPRGVVTELVCVVLTGLLSMPVAVAFQFLPVYHLLHDVGVVHTQLCVLLMGGAFVLLAWVGDRSTQARLGHVTSQQRGKKWTSYFDELSVSVLLHFMFYVSLVLWAEPASYRSTGPHQTVGDCNVTTYVNTPLGMRLPKQPYLCLSNYSEPYFDFHCLPPSSLPAEGDRLYTVCGTPYQNRLETQLLVIGGSLLGLVVYYQWLFNSTRTKIKKS